MFLYNKDYLICIYSVPAFESYLILTGRKHFCYIIGHCWVSWCLCQCRLMYWHCFKIAATFTQWYLHTDIGLLPNNEPSILIKHSTILFWSLETWSLVISYFSSNLCWLPMMLCFGGNKASAHTAVLAESHSVWNRLSFSYFLLKGEELGWHFRGKDVWTMHRI